MKKQSYKKLFSLKDKNAVVTGGVGMLGRKFCRGLAEFGANVAVVDVKAREAAVFAKELSGDYGVKAIGIGCDVSSKKSVQVMAKLASDNLGAIHILHNNAASQSRNLKAYFSKFEPYSEKEWRKEMSVNIDGMFLVAQALGGRMAKSGGGSMIQTASIYGIMAPDQRIYEGSFYRGARMGSPAVYSASKGAVVALTKYLAAYWAPKGIRVNTLTPGGVQSGQNHAFVKKYSDRIPMKRMAQADEMVGALIFLASDASSYMTGHNLVVDGGLSAW